jgi:pyrroloquinoline-quinone synthase
MRALIGRALGHVKARTRSVAHGRPAAAVSEPGLTWEAVAAARNLDDAVKLVEARYDFHVHPYFVWSDAPHTSKSEFRHTQVPFRFAVESYSQALAAVLAHVPQLEMRLLVAENVAEEHGHGKARASHKATFHGYLRALGATEAELAEPCPVAVSAFNYSLLDFCLVQPYESGAAALGIIEHLYVGISTSIARTLHHRAWVAPGSQRHYDVHQELDVSHARDLLALCQPGFRESRTRAQIALGLALGAHWFWRLYLDLYAMH